MVPSKYNVYATTERGDHLVLNTLSRAMVVLPQHEFLVLNSRETSRLAEDVQCVLLDQGILVSDTADDACRLEYYLNRSRNANILSLTLVLGHACNLRCTYCYEFDQISQGNGTQTIDPYKVLHWVGALLKSEHPKLVHVAFYGVEPLLYMPLLSQLADGIRKLCRSHQVGFNYELMTNAVLLDRQLSQRLKELEVKCLQLTLDGPPKVHNAMRPDIDGQGTFDRILHNVTDAVPFFERIIIRVNVEGENLLAINELLDILASQPWANHIIVYFTPVIRECDKRHSCPGSAANTSFAMSLAALTEAAYQRGLKTPDSLYTIAPCHLMELWSFVVAPNGDLYKCLAIESLCVGNIETSRFNRLQAKSVALDTWRQCMDCPYVPLCFGGCRYKSVIAGNDFTKIHCERQLLEHMTREYMLNRHRKLTERRSDESRTDSEH